MNAEVRVRSYITAFYEAAFERWVGALERTAASLATEPQLIARLQDPSADFEERRRLLDRSVPADTDIAVRNLLYTMLKNGELGLLAEVTDGLRRRMSQSEAGPVPVDVTSAIELTVQQRATLESTLHAQYGPALDFTYRVDPAILGGMIIRVGDKLIDGSVASRLAAMKQSLGVMTAG